MHKDRGIQNRQEATAQLVRAARGARVESIDPVFSIGRVLASDVYGACHIPESPSSMRDGYALCASETRGATVESPVALTLSGLIPAEAVRVPLLEPGNIVRVLTGGPIPEGADAVVPDERVRCHDGRVIISAPVRAGKHVLSKGEDLPDGGRIGRAKDVVTAQMAAVMVRARVCAVEVHALPRAAVFAIGSELSDPYAPGAGGACRPTMWSLPQACSRPVGLMWCADR